MATFPIEIATLLEQAGDPLAAANTGKLYSKEQAGVTHLFYRADDGAVYQITPTPPVQVNTTYYVATAGNDADDGLTPATAFQTLGRADLAIPLSVEAVYEIIVIDDAAPFEFPGVRARTYADGGLIYIRSAVDTTLAGFPAVSIAGTGSTAVVIAGAPWVADAYAGKWIEFLDGAAAGSIRSITRNTTNTITPAITFFAPFSPAPGDTFRIFEPSTVLNETTVNTAPLGGSANTTAPQTNTGLYLERFAFSSTRLRIGNKVGFFICSTDSMIGSDAGGRSDNVSAGDNEVLSGVDPRAPGLIHTLDSSQYFGAGLTLLPGGLNPGIVRQPIVGFVCAIGVAAKFAAARVYLRGGRLDTGLTLDGLTAPCNALLFSEGPIAQLRIDAAAGAALTVINAAVCALSRATIVAAASFGALVQFGGQVRITTAPTVVGFPAGSDFAVGNVPTVAPSAAFAAVGATLIPAVVIDGSIAQRVA